jgi:hypothetical protein
MMVSILSGRGTSPHSFFDRQGKRSDERSGTRDQPRKRALYEGGDQPVGPEAGGEDRMKEWGGMNTKMPDG